MKYAGGKSDKLPGRNRVFASVYRDGIRKGTSHLELEIMCVMKDNEGFFIKL